MSYKKIFSRVIRERDFTAREVIDCFLDDGNYRRGFSDEEAGKVRDEFCERARKIVLKYGLDLGLTIDTTIPSGSELARLLREHYDLVFNKRAESWIA